MLEELDSLRTLLGDIVVPVRPISRNDTYGFVFRYLTDKPGLPALPVWDEPDRFGLIDRNEFFARYARPYGRELFENRTIESIVSQDILKFDVSAGIADVASALSESRESEPRSAILVTRDGQLVGIATSSDVMRAVSAQALAALAELERAQEELIEAETLASLGQLVAGVSHEINTPIGVALTAATFFRERVQRTTDAAGSGTLTKSDFTGFLNVAQETSQIISSNIERAAELIQSFKQVAVDQVTLQIARINLKRQIDDIAASIDMHLRHAGRRLVVNCPPDLELATYPGALTQVLTNLVMNANIHAFPEGAAGTVTIEARRTNSGKIELVVADDGCGIPAEHIDRIFEPFFTTKRGRGGTGLGLHIVHNLVYQKLGGRLTLASEPGKGSRFVIKLPDQITAAPAETLDDTGTSSRRRRRRAPLQPAEDA